MILYTIGLLIASVTTCCVIFFKTGKRKRISGLSEAGKRIMDVYLFIPKDQRPGIDIEHVIRQLDDKFDKKNTDKHFIKTTEHYSGHLNREFNWHSHNSVEFGCDGIYRTQNCQYRAYVELCTQINDIRSAVIERDRALRKAEFDNRGLSIDDINLITERLRTEAGIIRQVTKELQ